ncbi:GIY-YIG nuclease family protein [Lysobacter auxotrophicus]|uniref:GIY-YIG nuclease family protein n=1 Tax=Lysobacter auxotrophicus TaxID=2992573 RepID=A0ABM8DCG7_9GAMM|nr:GIY-YIG nuclease family protein [Lysobacter auxotrophicus]
MYILASQRNGTLYVGVTGDLVQRIHQHVTNVVPGFTRRYGVHTLVWFEPHESIVEGIRREKRIKEWRRSWKIQLIESTNPQWRDLSPDIL